MADETGCAEQGGNESISYDFKLRTGGPFPDYQGGFVTHTFMAEKREITLVELTVQLLTSSDMSLQGGLYESASYSALQYTAGTGSEIAFSGKEVKKPTYIEEDQMGII